MKDGSPARVTSRPLISPISVPMQITRSAACQGSTWPWMTIVPMIGHAQPVAGADRQIDFAADEEERLADRDHPDRRHGPQDAGQIVHAKELAVHQREKYEHQAATIRITMSRLTSSRPTNDCQLAARDRMWRHPRLR